MPTGHALLIIVGVALAVIGLLQTAAGVLVLFRRQPLRFAMHSVVGAAIALAGLLALAIAAGVQGYQALTHEAVAATIFVKPSGLQRVDVHVQFPDGREASYVLAGDQIYVDARVLKWKPFANMLGLHTAYELDRIAGRYEALEQERTAIRTIYPLGSPRALDLFGLRRRHAWLAPLLDAEYGSATYVSVTKPVTLEVRVSTTGLLIREGASR